MAAEVVEAAEPVGVPAPVLAAAGSGSAPGGPAADPLTGWLTGVLDRLGHQIGPSLAAGSADDAARIDRIALLEQIKAAAAAVQAAETVAFARAQVAAQRRADLDPARVGRGIADQLALACRVSPTEGSRRLGLARAWVADLPGTFDLLARGQISEYKASLIAAETRHLDAATRRRVDAQLLTDRVDTLGVAGVAARAKERAYAADPHGYTTRGRTERRHRRVSLRPAPDTMTWLTGYLPVEQGVACLAALKRHTDTRKAGGDPRSRDQIMADTLVERLTGQPAADHLPVEIRLLAAPDTLTGSDRPARLDGHGPLPAPLARALAAGPGPTRTTGPLPTGTTDPTDPTCPGDPTGPGDPVESRARRYTGRLRDHIQQRDQTCRDPYCDAPIRHLDHITRWADGGPTTATNGRGVCERGNYLRELPGWQIRLTDPDTHTITTTTPTGHSYTSQPPQPP